MKRSTFPEEAGHEPVFLRPQEAAWVERRSCDRRRHRAHLRRVLLLIFIYGDTSTIRALLAVASLWFGILMIPDTIWPDSRHIVTLFGWDIHTPGPLHIFERPVYAGMKLLWSQGTWCALFLAHAIGVTWRFIEIKPRIVWALAINSLGFGIWALSTSLMTWQVGELVPSMAMEMTMIAMSLIALCRTGLNDEKFSP